VLVSSTPGPIGADVWVSFATGLAVCDRARELCPRFHACAAICGRLNPSVGKEDGIGRKKEKKKERKKERKRKETDWHGSHTFGV